MAGKKLTLREVCQLVLAYDEGEGAAIAAAVILAESGGRTDAVNVNRTLTGGVASTDRGLWQINDKAHPSVTAAQAFDPIASTAYARKISGGFKNFKPWAAYTNGSYTRFLPLTRGEVKQLMDDEDGENPWVAAVAAVGGAAVDAGGAVVDGIRSVDDFVAALGQRSTWVRVVQVVGGLGLVVAGAFLLKEDVITGVGSAAVGLVPGGTAAREAASAVVKN